MMQILRVCILEVVYASLGYQYNAYIAQVSETCLHMIVYTNVYARTLSISSSLHFISTTRSSISSYFMLNLGGFPAPSRGEVEGLVTTVLKGSLLLLTGVCIVYRGCDVICMFSLDPRCFRSELLPPCEGREGRMLISERLPALESTRMEVSLPSPTTEADATTGVEGAPDGREEEGEGVGRCGLLERDGGIRASGGPS